LSYIPKIVIVCPTEISAVWSTGPIADLFIGGNIHLRVKPNSYKQITEGTASQFNDFFNGVGYNQSPQRRGFDVTVDDHRDELAIALQELAKLSLGTQYTDFKPVTILDYCRVDDSADYARGCAIRVGKISVENLTGTIQRGNLICSQPAIEQPQLGRYNEGFSLRFTSLKKSVIS
jgi:hypothetical protein